MSEVVTRVPVSELGFGNGDVGEIKDATAREAIAAMSQMTGATSSTNGTSGMVPAPTAGNQSKYLQANGTWSIPTGSKPVEFTLDTVTNASGAYSHTTSNADATATMKALKLELGNPGVFHDRITVNLVNGGIQLSCPDVSGTSTVKVTAFEMAQNSGEIYITSEEFDVLAGRIGALANLNTTEKGSLVGAINELIASKGAVNGIATLDSSGKVPASQLPSYVDDIESYATSSGFPATGEDGKIYVAKDTNKSYRWNGTGYTELSTYDVATQSASGLMSSADKTKLDGVATGATANVVSDSLSDTSTTNALSAAKGKALNDTLTSQSQAIGNLPNLTTTEKGSLVGAANELNSNIAKLDESIAIVSDNNTHANIPALQYVYVKNHETLAEGLYKANSAISANAALSSSNLTAVSGGGLNSVVNYVYSGNLGRPQVSDLNDALNGNDGIKFFIFAGTAANAPTNSAGFGITCAYDANSVFQIVWISTKMYRRARSWGTWSNWVSVTMT